MAVQFGATVEVPDIDLGGWLPNRTPLGEGGIQCRLDSGQLVGAAEDAQAQEFLGARPLTHAVSLGVSTDCGFEVSGRSRPRSVHSCKVSAMSVRIRSG